MTKKIVFLDIDGTILNHEKQIPEATKNAVKQLQDNGIDVAIATGRSIVDTTEIAAVLGISNLVTFNGAHVTYDGETVYKQPFEIEDMDELIVFATKHNHALCICSETEDSFTSVNE